MFNKRKTLKGFADGKIISITEVPDKTFSTKMMGEGIAIIPENGIVYTPTSGKVEELFPTGHAIGISTKQKNEILIHIGIDTLYYPDLF